MVDVDVILEKLRKFNLPTEKEIKGLYNKVREILDTLDNVAQLECPMTVCGDIYGQFEDLLEIFDVGGEVSETNLQQCRNIYIFINLENKVSTSYNLAQRKLRISSNISNL